MQELMVLEIPVAGITMVEVAELVVLAGVLLLEDILYLLVSLIL
jgi:hypothetical protein